ncbi:MAG: ribbon-helix-helix protein, CopG family [Betaproteobacteria bacterium]|nr:ribbon-helix-helix protein, CopG family [Betaproteobacteria bacterium]
MTQRLSLRYSDVSAQYTNRPVFLMPLSIRFSPEEQQQIDALAQRRACSRSDLVRQAVREFCRRISGDQPSPLVLGEDLFGAGRLAGRPSDPAKRAVWERLLAKHRRAG